MTTSNVQFSLVDTGEQKFITVFVNGEVKATDDSNPQFDAILAGALNGEDVSDLFDLTKTVSTKFSALSERVSVANGRVYLDGDEQHDTITTQIIRFLDEGTADWYPLVEFMEKVAANPTEHSREQLYDWLRQEGLTISDHGDIVGYKAVKADAEGTLRSINAGAGLVNGTSTSGHLDNSVGNVVEMPRGKVAHNPAHACSRGLHVATEAYARSFGGDNAHILEVHVNPHDVVSVPTDASGKKVRVCRYTVAGVYEGPVVLDGRYR